MKKALIAPSGEILEVTDNEFPVAEPFVWKSVANNTDTNDTYDFNTKKVVKYVKAAPTPLEKRQVDYVAKGWKTPFDLIDDILDRGVEAVKSDRDAIKTKYPKND